MNWFTGIAVYVVTWWVVLFTVLPWGNRPPDEAEPGHAESAPEKPRLWLKTAVTTVLAGAIWAGIYWMIDAGLVDLRGWTPR